MAENKTESPQVGPVAPLPSLLVHNFTALKFPERLPNGLLIETRKALSLKDIYPFSVLVLTPSSLEAGEEYDFLFQHVGVMLWDPEGESGGSDRKLAPWVDIRLSSRPTEAELQLGLGHMVRLLELKEQTLKLHNAAAITETRNRQLNQIGVALMAERNLNTLLNLILEKAMSLTGSDAGCLYLVEPKEGAEEDPADYWRNKQVRFKLTRNYSVAFDFTETVMTPALNSIVGHALHLGKPLNIHDVYSIPAASPYRHNRGFDQSSGYRTRSMLTLPMKDHDSRVIGAIQLINRCKAKGRPITSLEAADEQVVPFRQEDVNLSLSLASQASAALLNAQYEQDIENLFEGFINASVTAIESRDPTTSGHSSRVAEYCMNMAGALGRQETGKYKGAKFSETQLRELRYAALLHDFGKIGVREPILTKAKKLFPEELDRIKSRAEFIKRTLQWQSAEALVRILRAHGLKEAEEEIRKLGAEERIRMAEVDELLDCLSRANEPSFVPEDLMRRLRELGSRSYLNLRGRPEAYLEAEEMARLTIPKGTLSREERLEIESHVTHTFKFLSQIPWTRDLRQVPHIAYAHPEKLDGSGYPRQLGPADIPLSSQVMTICDIYDALTASDRPYKKAIPTDKALDILGYEVKEGKIDPDLFKIFLDGKLYILNP